MDIPQVANGKRPDEPMNAGIHLIWLPAKTPFGNLALKHIKILGEIDWANRRITEAFLSYDRARVTPFPHADLSEHHHISEEIIHWLRTTADEMISLSHVLRTRVQSGSYPSRICCDSVGSLVADQDAALLASFRRFVPFLTKLNEISNAYKHSFLMSDLNLMGRDEPVVFALALKRNNLERVPEFHAISLRFIVLAFSEFYVFVTGFVAGLAANLQHIEEQTE